MGVSGGGYLNEEKLADGSQSSGWVIALAFTMMLAVGFFYSAAGLVMPDGARYVVWALWLGMLVFHIRSRDRAWLVLTIPLAALVLLVTIVSVGDALLNWSA